MDLLRKIAWSGFVGVFLILSATGLLSQLGCGSSANIDNTENGGLGQIEEPTSGSTDSDTATAENLPEVSELADTDNPTYIVGCTDENDANINGDPDTDYVTITCGVENETLVYLYYCVDGIVTREIEDSDDAAETLFDAVSIECENRNNAPVLTEEELIVS